MIRFILALLVTFVLAAGQPTSKIEVIHAALVVKATQTATPTATPLGPTATQTATPTSSSTPNPVAFCYFTTNVYNMPVFDYPLNDSREVARLDQPVLFRVIEAVTSDRGDLWYSVSDESISGWVLQRFGILSGNCGEYIQATTPYYSPRNTPELGLQTQCYGTLQAPFANQNYLIPIRNGAWMTAPIVAEIRAEGRIQILGAVDYYDRYYRVSGGFIHSEFIFLEQGCILSVETATPYPTATPIR